VSQVNSILPVAQRLLIAMLARDRFGKRLVHPEEARRKPDRANLLENGPLPEYADGAS
jgi:hypothetical protein